MTEYEAITKRYGTIHRNRCIDGNITGQSCCVGYCKFCEHRGFLTEKLRSQHNCIEKGCHYYIPKERTTEHRNQKEKTDSVLANRISNCLSSFEGMKVMRIIQRGSNDWIINYITISNDYPINEVSREIENETGYTLIWNDLNYDYETAAKLIFA